MADLPVRQQLRAPLERNKFDEPPIANYRLAVCGLPGCPGTRFLVSSSCPWLRGAGRTGDPTVLAIVLRVHPASHCPAAWRDRAR